MKREKRVLIIDSGLGNINSLVNCIDSLDFKYQVISDPNTNIDFDKRVSELRIYIYIFPNFHKSSNLLFNFKSLLDVSAKKFVYIKKNLSTYEKEFIYLY